MPPFPPPPPLPQIPFATAANATGRPQSPAATRIFIENCAVGLVPFATVSVRRELAGMSRISPVAAAHVLVHSSRLAQGGVVVVVALLLPSLELLTMDRVASR